jgi:hypothetical protein
MSGAVSSALADDEIKALLTAALQRLHAELTSIDRLPVGTPLTASITGASAEIDVSDLLDGVLDLGWLAQTGAQLGKAAQGNLDYVNSLTQQLQGTSLAGATASAEGLIGSVVGLVKVPRLRVRVDIHWKLTDHHGKDLVAGEDFLTPTGLTLPSVQILIPPLFQEMTFDSLRGGFNFCRYYLTVTVSLSIGDVWANIGLPAKPAYLAPPPITAGKGTPKVQRAVPVPDTPGAPTVPNGIPIIALPLLLPTLVALFSNPNFNPYDPSPGKLLIMVPFRSPLASLEQLQRYLNKLDQQVANLRELASFATALLGIDVLSDALSDQPGARLSQARPLVNDPQYDFAGGRTTRFDKQLEAAGYTPGDGLEFPQGIADLRHVVFYKKPSRFWWLGFDEDSVTMNDAPNSLVVLGLPATQLTFFNAVAYEGIVGDTTGVWSLTIPSLEDTTNPHVILPFVIIRELGQIYGEDRDDPRPPPEALPPGTDITVIRDAAEAPRETDYAWGGNMSSLWFDSLGTAIDCDGVPPPPTIY